MTETIALERKLKSAADLHQVVRTMKTLAAVALRRYEEAVHSLDGYSQTVELGLAAVLGHRPLAEGRSQPSRTIALFLGSDQGLAGRFNEALVDFGDLRLRGESGDGPPVTCWVVGERMAGIVEERWQAPEERFLLPASVTAITASVREVLLRFDQCSRQQSCRLLLLHNRPAQGGAYRQQQTLLMPPDEQWLAGMAGHPWPGRCLPMVPMARADCFSALIGEYLFVALYRGFAASLAAENSARLAAMQRAEKNIEELQDDLLARHRSLRQAQITEELLDIIAGFEALGGTGD